MKTELEYSSTPQYAPTLLPVDPSPLVACQDPPNDRQPRPTDAAPASRLHQGPYAPLAIEAAKRAVERDPTSAVAHRNLADAYARDNKLTEALAAYEQAIALQPDYAKAQTELAIVLTRLNRHAEALALLEEVTRETPDYAWAQMALGLLYFRQAQYEQAIAAYGRAVALQDDYSEAWYNLGEAHLKLNDYAGGRSGVCPRHSRRFDCGQVPPRPRHGLVQAPRVRRSHR